jgi:hypothetical protein
MNELLSQTFREQYLDMNLQQTNIKSNEVCKITNSTSEYAFPLLFNFDFIQQFFLETKIMSHVLMFAK